MTDGLEMNILYTISALTDGDLTSDGEGFSNLDEIQCGFDSSDAKLQCSTGLPWLKILLD